MFLVFADDTMIYERVVRELKKISDAYETIYYTFKDTKSGFFKVAQYERGGSMRADQERERVGVLLAVQLAHAHALGLLSFEEYIDRKEDDE